MMDADAIVRSLQPTESGANTTSQNRNSGHRFLQDAIAARFSDYSGVRLPKSHRAGAI
jgi:hypothetical protein